MANKYTISKGSAPVEKNIISLSYEGLIDACQFDKDTFVEWLDENHYDDVSSGEEYENEVNLIDEDDGFDLDYYEIQNQYKGVIDGK